MNTEDIQRHNRTILVAEDEEINFYLLNILLKRITNFDFEIIRAINGQEAVDYAKSNPSIDLVLMDIRMPILDGLEATALIKKIRPDLPIVAQTAYSTENDRLKALEAGCIEFLTKPIDQDKLTLIANNLLHPD